MATLVIDPALEARLKADFRGREIINLFAPDGAVFPGKTAVVSL